MYLYYRSVLCNVLWGALVAIFVLGYLVGVEWKVWEWALAGAITVWEVRDIYKRRPNAKY